MKTPPPTSTSPSVGRPSAAPPTPRHRVPAGSAWSSPTRRSATSAAKSTPRLRLVNDAATIEHQPASHVRPAPPTPISGATDPRWVLAVRTAESLQGDVLPPAKRDRLMRLAKALGLTPFDGCLILAMIQDQARRGLIAQHCPAAAEPQLAMVPLPQPRAFFPELQKNPLGVGFIVAGILAFQALLMWVLMS